MRLLLELHSEEDVCGQGHEQVSFQGPEGPVEAHKRHRASLIAIIKLVLMT